MTIIKNILLSILMGTAFSANAQKTNWQNLDPKTDSVFGISTEKAYNELLKGKTPKPVIVAVIDAGVDTNHEDLKTNLWHNPKPKPFDNGTYGWSFIGSAKGNIRYDNLELTRQVRQFQTADTSHLSASSLMTFHTEKKALANQLKQAQQALLSYTAFVTALDAVAGKINKQPLSLSDVQAFVPAGKSEQQVKNVLLKALVNEDYLAFHAEIDEAIAHFKAQADYQLNIGFDPRSLVGDDYFDSKQHHYGSPDNNGPDPTHGTHVAGIIAGIRGNGLGADGIADDVKILAIRTVPDGDERDKDVANAIRYAADHGAKVINMSFGKGYSQDKKAVDKAVRYALRKDVLLVQAAGNSNQDIDTAANFPNRNYTNGKQAGAWIVVGASGPKNDSTLKASFSNYGKTAVDVFAPGLHIYSSIPGSKYAYFDGTSMACPVVAGLAAVIREYHPKLKAMQVKQIILQSVVVSPFLKDLCSTAGVVNAYNALELAAKLDQ